MEAWLSVTEPERDRYPSITRRGCKRIGIAGGLKNRRLWVRLPPSARKTRDSRGIRHCLLFNPAKTKCSRSSCGSSSHLVSARMSVRTRSRAPVLSNTLNCQSRVVTSNVLEKRTFNPKHGSSQFPRPTQSVQRKSQRYVRQESRSYTSILRALVAHLVQW